MADPVIEELWRIKDGIAREHDDDLEALAAHLRAKERLEGQRIVDLHALKEAGTTAPASPVGLRR